MKKIYIVVAIHNRFAHTLKFIDSLKQSVHKNFQIVVVDDGSTDNSSSIITNKYPEIIILQGDGDLWWSKSMNLGIKYAISKGADYILTLNNDNIIDKKLISEFLFSIKDDNKKIIFAKVYDLKKTKLYCGGAEWEYPFPLMNPFGNKDNEKYNHEREITCGIGMGMFLSSQVFKEIGFFNEKFLPQYYADCEFTLRARKAGYKLIFNPKAIIFNDMDATWKLKGKLGISLIKELFLSKKSLLYLPAITYMIWNYWPKRQLPQYFIRSFPRLLKRVNSARMGTEYERA